MTDTDIWGIGHRDMRERVLLCTYLCVCVCSYVCVFLYKMRFALKILDDIFSISHDFLSFKYFFYIKRWRKRKGERERERVKSNSFYNEGMKSFSVRCFLQY